MLRKGLAALELELTDGQVAQLLDYARLLQKWGRVYNLTALLTPDEIVTHHLLDSLSVIRPLRQMAPFLAAPVLDVGSGAGLPGAVIAIACPELAVDCVDAVAKKAAFVQQVAGSLRLGNLRGIHARVEQLEQRYGLVTSRAFASLTDFVQWSSSALLPDGLWMAMKGKYPADEVQALGADIEMFHVEQLQVPGLAAERCAVWMRRHQANVH